MQLESITPQIPLNVSRRFEFLCVQLQQLLADGLIIAFSGGVDSAFLLWAAEHVRKQSGGRLLALTAVSASMAKHEREDAKRFATSLGVEHVWEDSLEVSKPEYIANDGTRCYYCKSELFRIAHDVAGRHGFKWLAYGFNVSDRGDVRPGHRAALENDVLSPLAEAELTKDDIRILMRAHQLALAEKPASPCLASRIMTGVSVTPQKLSDVEELENILRENGARVFRVRLHEEASKKFLRIEIADDEVAVALKAREQLVSEGRRRGYQWVTLDLAGYKMGGGNV